MTAQARSTRAPRDLDIRGRAFWRKIMAVFDLSEAESQLLHEACRLLDETDLLRAAIETDGATVPGSQGQVRLHPAFGELRQQRVALGRILAQIKLPDDEGEVMPSPTSARASKAAQARWAKTARLPTGKHG